MADMRLVEFGEPTLELGEFALELGTSRRSVEGGSGGPQLLAPTSDASPFLDVVGPLQALGKVVELCDDGLEVHDPIMAAR